MRRTALRKKSKKPRKWENWTLNRRYADAHPFDPLASFFPEYAPGLAGIDFGGLITPVRMYEETATQNHHITGGILGTPRWDIDANLIHLGAVTHRWCETFTHDGFALCLIAKKAMGEFERYELNRIFHHDVIDWLDEQLFEFEWVRERFRVVFRLERA